MKKIRSLKEQLGGGGGSQEGREEVEEEQMRRRGGEVREELGIQCDLGDSEALVEAYSGSCTR